MHLREIGEKMKACSCACARWSWGLDSLRTGVVLDASERPHHPSCKCAAGIIGCRGDVLSGSVPGHVMKRCAEHGAPSDLAQGAP